MNPIFDVGSLSNEIMPIRRIIMMSEYGFTKRDWALFKEKIAGWQEAYMDKLNKEYIELLSGKGSPSEKFWALEERIRNDKKIQVYS